MRSDVRILCDANYVNNPQVDTMDGSWLIQAYPGGASEFSAVRPCPACIVRVRPRRERSPSPRRRARSRCAQRATSRARSGATSDKVVLPEQGTPGSGIPGWRYDAAAGLIEIDFTHSGGTTVINY